MKTLWPFLITSGILATGCGSPDLHSESDFVELFGGAVSVRKVDSVSGLKEIQLEIVVNEPGWIRIGYGPEGVSTSFQVSETSYRRLLRIANEEIEAKVVLDSYISPLFGREIANDLRFSLPEIVKKKIVHTRMFWESFDLREKSSVGPFVTPVPTPYGSSHFGYTANSKSSEVDGPVRLAGWVYMVDPESGLSTSSSGAGIGGDLVTAHINGSPVEFDGVAAVFRELTIEFSTEPLTGSTEHPCAVANRRCPAGQ